MLRALSALVSERRLYGAEPALAQECSILGTLLQLKSWCGLALRLWSNRQRATLSARSAEVKTSSLWEVTETNQLLNML
jgi:hypothetical protein